MRSADLLLLAIASVPAAGCREAPPRPSAAASTSPVAIDAPRFANSAWRQPSQPRERVDPARIDLPRFAGGDLPAYPEESVRRQEEGSVGLRFELRENGSVKELGIERSSGFSSLDAAALAAARTWRFLPTTGAPTAGENGIEVLRYRLQFRLVDG